MTIEFEYTGDIGWLSTKERKMLFKDLKSCTSEKNWDYFDVTRKHISIGGTLTNEDDFEDYLAIERVLDDFDIEWTGKAKEKEEDDPNWDAMRGGYDYEFARSL